MVNIVRPSPTTIISTLCIIYTFTGEYSMLEHESVPGVVECMKITTATETKRLVHYAFQYAIKHDRKKVTLIHKAVSYIFILHN